MRRIIILGIVVIAVIALWSAGWLFVAGEARKAIVALADDHGTGDPTLSCARLDIGGYPFRLDVTCGTAVIAAEDLTATIHEVRATVLVYRLNQVLLFARGPLLLDDAFSGAKSRLTWGSFESSVRLTDWRIARFSLVAENLSWADTLATDALIANAGHLELHVLDVPEKRDEMAHTAELTVVARLTGLTAPGLQINAGDSELEAEITRVPDEIARFGAPDALRQWQAAGGDVTIRTLKGEDGANFFDVGGTVKLGASGQPDGQLLIRSRGLVERFAGALSPELKPLIVGNPEADGSYSQTLTIAGGVMLSGLMPVAQLQPLW